MHSALFSCRCGRSFVVHWPTKPVRGTCPKCQAICKAKDAKIGVALKKSNGKAATLVPPRRLAYRAIDPVIVPAPRKKKVSPQRRR